MKSFWWLLLVNSIYPQAKAFQYNIAAWQSCNVPRASCVAHYNAGCRTDGNYKINPSGSAVSAFCDMTQDGGGWMRLNGNLATSSISFGASDMVSGNNNGANCSGATDVAITAVIPTYTQIKTIVNRTTTLMQCLSLTNVTTVYPIPFYWTGSAWATLASNTCNWGPTWSSGSTSNLSTTGLPLEWKMLYTATASTNSFSLVTGCSSSSDNGAYTAQFFVK